MATAAAPVRIGTALWVTVRGNGGGGPRGRRPTADQSAPRTCRGPHRPRRQRPGGPKGDAAHSDRFSFLRLHEHHHGTESHVWSVHSAALYRESAHPSRHFCDFCGENSLATETARARPAVARTRLGNLLTATATPRTHPDVAGTRPANAQCSVVNPRPLPVNPGAQIPAPQSRAASRDTQLAVAREFSRPRSHQARDGIAHSRAGVAPSRAGIAHSRAGVAASREGVADWRVGIAASRAETADWRAGDVDWRAWCVEQPQAPCAPGAEIRRSVL
jgi:hypothetical protein